MVKKEIKNNEEYFRCEECGMYYKTRETAQKCENFCKKHHACNTEIMKHAVQF